MAGISVLSRDYRLPGDDISLDLTSKWTKINLMGINFTRLYDQERQATIFPSLQSDENFAKLHCTQCLRAQAEGIYISLGMRIFPGLDISRRIQFPDPITSIKNYYPVL